MPLPLADAAIVGVGARAPNGLTALQVAMCTRAGYLAPEPSHIVDSEGESIATCRVAAIGDAVFGVERLVALAAPALREAASPWLAMERRAQGALGERTGAGAVAGGRPLALVIALPPRNRPGFEPVSEHELCARLELASGVALDRSRCDVVLACRAGGVAAFSRALELLQSGHTGAVLVGGVDSFFDPDALEWLDHARRLHGLETENGFIPGEGAAFVLLARRSAAVGLHRFGQVLSAVTADEPHPYGSDEPCLARGITDAVQRAAAVLGPKAQRIPWLLTDVVNERHRVDEWTAAMLRAHEALAPAVRHDQPLTELGDLGAASAPMLVALAAMHWYARSAPGDCALVAAHSEGRERGAMVVSEEPS